MQRHLATFEAANRDARAGRLAFAAAAARLAEARTDATADTHAKFAGAGIVFDAIEPHGPKLLFHLRPATPLRGAGRRARLVTINCVWRLPSGEPAAAHYFPSPTCTRC